MMAGRISEAEPAAAGPHGPQAAGGPVGAPYSGLTRRLVLDADLVHNKDLISGPSVVRHVITAVVPTASGHTLPRSSFSDCNVRPQPGPTVSMSQRHATTC